MRRQLKINNQISWNTITYFLLKYNIDLELIKVKAHSDNWVIMKLIESLIKDYTMTIG